MLQGLRRIYTDGVRTLLSERFLVYKQNYPLRYSSILDPRSLQITMTRPVTKILNVVCLCFVKKPTNEQTNKRQILFEMDHLQDFEGQVSILVSQK